MDPTGSKEAPYPELIIHDTGALFIFGVIGGTTFQFLKGIYNSPKGTRFISGTQAVTMNVPRIGGSFAVWGATVTSLECAMIYARQKEDPWNSIIAGFTAGGLLGMRHGLRPAMRRSVWAAGLCALIEGADFMSNRYLDAQQQPLRPLQYDIAG